MAKAPSWITVTAQTTADHTGKLTGTGFRQTGAFCFTSFPSLCDNSTFLLVFYAFKSTLLAILFLLLFDNK